MKADPNDAVAAFTEYAADQLWGASHLMQLAGLTLMVAGAFGPVSTAGVGARQRMVTDRGRRSDYQSGRNRGATGS